MTINEIWLWVERHHYMALRVGTDRITSGRESWSAYLRGMSNEQHANFRVWCRLLLSGVATSVCSAQ